MHSLQVSLEEIVQKEWDEEWLAEREGKVVYLSHSSVLLPQHIASLAWVSLRLAQQPLTFYSFPQWLSLNVDVHPITLGFGRGDKLRNVFVSGKIFMAGYGEPETIEARCKFVHHTGRWSPKSIELFVQSRAQTPQTHHFEFEPEGNSQWVIKCVTQATP